MSRKKPRHLSAEEKELWEKVAERTNPMEHSPKGLPDLMPTPKPKPKVSPKPAKPLQPFKIGAKATSTVPRHSLAPSISDQTRAAPVQMDRKSFNAMNRGKLKPEGRIDLHGMTLSEAHPELIAFILNAQSAGKRLVLVITGKGRTSHDTGPIPVRKGILRHQLPIWLSQSPLRQAVLQVTEAHLKHGGGGAFYVYLRRRR